MIKSFASAETESLFDAKRLARWVNIETVVLRKPVQLNAARNLDFLRIPPGNRLEALAGDRKGQHSIRINGRGASVSCGWTGTLPRS